MLHFNAKNLFNWALIAGLSAFAIACDDDDDNNNNNPMDKTTIAEVAMADPELSTLVTVLQVTGLDAVVADENANLTVFAPTNTAFQNLLDALQVADLNELVATLGAEAVTEIVKYHVLGTEVMSSQISNGYVTTLGENARGKMMSMYLKVDNGVVINNDAASVEEADINADNGVIHKVNAVILPPTIADLIIANAEYSSLVAAVTAADPSVLAAASNEEATLTLFAPNDAAFGDLLQELNLTSLADVVAALGQDGLTDVLLYHVLPAEVVSSDLQPNMTGVATALANATIDIAISGNGTVTITDGAGRQSNVTAVDIQGSNGVIHRINTVILPQ